MPRHLAGLALRTDHRVLIVAEPPEYPEAPVIEGRLTNQFIRHWSILPPVENEDGLVVAMVDRYVRQAIEMASGRPVVPRIALPSDFDAAYARLYEPQKGTQTHATAHADIGSDDDLLEDVDRLRDLASEVPVIRLVNQLITRAVENRASDIHMIALAADTIGGELREFSEHFPDRFDNCLRRPEGAGDGTRRAQGDGAEHAQSRGERRSE